MTVVNITKEGAEVSDLVGRVVTVEEAGPVYELVRKLNARRREGTKDRETNVQARQS